MAKDRFAKICLVVIVMLLSVIALNSIVRPQASYAAAKYDYQVRTENPLVVNSTQGTINKMAGDGWELVATTAWMGNTAEITLIFRRPL
jgi:hypothetical protein